MLVEPLEQRLLFSADPMATLTDGSEARESSEDQHQVELSAQNVYSILRGSTEPGFFVSETKELSTTQEFNDFESHWNTPPLTDLSAELNTPATPLVHLVVIDGNVADLKLLLDGISIPTDSTLEILILDSAEDGIMQVTQTLADLENVSSLHIVSHGAQGTVELAASTITAKNIDQFQHQIRLWGNSLTADADILIYGCEVAGNDAGVQLLESIATFSDRDVAASDNNTGSTNYGGDWVLEYQLGKINNSIIFSDEVINHWNHELAISANLIGHWNLNGTALDATDTNNAATFHSESYTLLEDALTKAGNFKTDAAGTAYLEIPDHTAYDFDNNDFTISFWYNTNNTPASGTQATLFSHGDTTESMQVYINDSGNLLWDVTSAGGTFSQSGTAAVNGSWQQVTLIKQGDQYSMWQDTTVVSTDTMPGLDLNAAATITLGASDGGANEFDGFLDDVKIYDAALSTTELNEVYTNTQPETPVTTIEVDTTLDYPTTDARFGDTSSVAALQADKGTDGLISLREAVIAANTDTGAGPFGISLGNQTYELSVNGEDEDDSATGDLDIKTTMMIVGVNPQTSIINGSIADRLIHVPDANSLSLGNLTLQGGEADSLGGGAVFIPQDSSLEGRNVVFKDNNAGGTMEGGGVYAKEGTVVLDQVSFLNNYGYKGGGLRIEGAGSTGTITNATFSGNIAEQGGGGLRISSSAVVTLDYSTVTKNHTNSSYGGGVRESSAEIIISNSIIANNTHASSSYNTDIYPSFTSGGYNIIPSDQGLTSDVTAEDIIGSDAGLATVAMVVDPVSGQYVYPIDSSSTAFQASNTTAPTEDQRGQSRTAPFDIGAYETDSALAVADSLDIINPPTIITDENSTLLFTGADSIQVEDNGASNGNNIQVTLSVANGLLTLNDTTGIAIIDGANSSSTLTIQGTESAVNTALASMEFVPDSNYHGITSLHVQLALHGQLEGYYTFENGDATDNSKPNTHNGTLEPNANPPIVISDTIRGQVLSLDGTDDHVYIGHDFGQPNSLSMGGWVNLAPGSFASEFLSIDDRLVIRLDTNNGVTAFVQTATNTWTAIETGINIAGTGWRHVFFAYDSATNTQKIYIDGKLAASQNNAISVDWAGAWGTYIGHHPTEGRYLNGYVDDIKIFTRAAEASEIMAFATDTGQLSETIKIDVQPVVNDAPTLTNIESTPAYYTENSTGFPLTGNLVVTDNTSTQIETATVSITNNFVPGEDILSMPAHPDISASYNSTTGVLELTGQASVSDFQNAIRSIAYSNSNDEPSLLTRTVGFTVYDGEFNSNTTTRDIEVLALNDLPELTTNTGGDSAVGATTTITNAMLNANDPDDNASDRIYSVTSISNGQLELSGNAGVAVTSFTQADIGNLVFVHDGLTSQDGSFDFTLADGEEDSKITSALNNDPTLSYDAITNKFYRFVNSPTDFVTARDAATSDLLNGVAGQLVTINSAHENEKIRHLVVSSGNQIWLGATDFTNEGTWKWLDGTVESQTFWTNGNAPDGGSAVPGVYASNLGLSNGNPDEDYMRMTPNGYWGDDNASSAYAYVVEWDASTVPSSYTPVTDTFVVTVTGAVPDTYSTDEDSTLTVDAPGLLANDSAGTAPFVSSIDTSSTAGNVSFNSDGSFEYQPNGAFDSLNIGQNASDSFEYTYDNGSGTQQTVTATITVTGANDAPSLGSIGPGSSYYGENEPNPVSVSGALEVTDADDTHIESATVSISNNFEAGEDVLNFSNQSGITGTYDSTSGVLTLTGSATVAEYDTALHSVTYHNTSEDPSTLDRAVKFIVSDGDSDSAAVYRDLVVFAENDPPVISVNTGASSSVGATTTITRAMLDEADPDDNGFELTFTATSINNGQLERTTNPGTAITTFTYGDIIYDRVVFVHDGLTAQNGSFDFSLADGGEDGAVPATGTFTITVNGAAPDTYTTDEDTTLNVNAAAGLLANDSPGSGTTAFVDSIDTSTTSGSVTFNADGSFIYQPDGLFESLEPGQSTIDTFDYTYDDGNGFQQTATATITVTGINDAPTLATIEAAPAYYTENSTGVGLTGNLSLADIDNSEIETATISISNNFVSAEDTLNFTDQLGITGAYDTATGILTLTGPASKADFETAIHSLTYSNSSNNPNTANRTIKFIINDGSLDSTALYRDIEILPVNDSPVIATNTSAASAVGETTTITTAMLNEGDPDDDGIELSYTVTSIANGQLELTSNAGVAVTAFTQSDIDAGLLVFVHDGLTTQNGSFDFTLADGGENSATTDNGTFVISVTGALPDSYTTDEDTPLTVTAPGLLANDSAGSSSFVSSIDTTNTIGTVSFNADGSFSYQPNGQFESLNTGQTATDTFDYTYDDGTGNQQTVTATITINGVNDAPTLATIETAPAYYTENNAGVGLTGNLSLADIDDSQIETATISITNNFISTEDALNFTDQLGITGAYDVPSGVLTLTGPATKADFETAIHSVTYSNSSDAPNTSDRTVEFIINDGSLDSTPLYRDIEVLPVNDSPVIAANTGAASAVGETTAITTAMLNEGDPDDDGVELNYSVTSTINGQLELTSNSGVAVTAFTQSDIDAGLLVFVHDGLTTQNGSFDFTLADGGENSATTDTGTFVISVTGALPDSYATDEDTTLTVTAPGLLANDSATSGSFVSSIDTTNTVGTVAFNADGSFSYQPNGQFESLNSGQTATDAFDYTYDDGTGNQQTVTATITINGVNDAPTLATIETAPVYYTENNAGVGLTGNLSVNDVDDALIESATVSIISNHIATEDVLALPAQPNITGTYNASSGVLTLTGAASPAEYEAAIHSVTYSNTSENPSVLTRTIEFSVNDGDTDSTVRTRDLSVVTVNDSPTVAMNIGASSIVGATTIISTSMLNEGDPDDSGTEIIYTATAVSNGQLELTNNPGVAVTTFTQNDIDSGTLQFVHDGLSIQNGSFDFSMADGGENGSTPASGTFTIAVTGALPDNYTTSEDATLNIIAANGLLANDSPGNGAIPFVNNIDTTNTSGSVSFNANGSFDYQPNGMFEGLAPGQTASDTFDYTYDSGNGVQQTVTATIAITGVNDAPTLATIEGLPVYYTENNTGTGLTGNLSLADIDDNIIDSATVSIISNFASGEDALTLPAQSNINSSFDATNGVLTLTGPATVTEFEDAIRAITYSNSSDEPSTLVRSVEFVINDGDTNSNILTRNLEIITVNDPPVISNNTGASSSVGASTVITNTMLSEGDLDDSGTDLTYTINSISNGQLELSSNPGIAVSTFTHADIVSNTLVFVHDGFSTQNGTFDFSMADGGENGAVPATGTFTVAVTGALPDTYITDEDTTLNIDAANGLLANDSPANGATPFVSSTNTSSTTGTASVYADGSFTYQPDSMFEALAPGQSASDTFEYTYDDGNGNQQSVTTTITIDGVNDAPVIDTLETTPASYTENGTAVDLTNTLTITDIDNAQLASATVAIVGNFTLGEDILTMTAQPGLAASYSASVGVLTITGPASVSEFETAIRSVTYQNSSDNPAAGTRTVEISVDDGSSTSNVLSRNIIITPINDAPVLSTIEGQPALYTENSTPSIITGNLGITDVDDTAIETATIKITGNFVNGQDELLFNNQSGINGTYDNTTGTLVLTGSASLADYEAAIHSIGYENTSDNPNTQTRTISITVNDGDNSSNTLTRDIEITAVNDAPQLQLIETTPAVFTENGNPVAITSTLTASDIDNTHIDSALIEFSANFSPSDDVLTYVDQNGIISTYNPTTGTLALTGSATIADYMTAIQSITYHNTSEDPDSNTRSIDITVSDGSLASNTLTRDINITPVNDAPVLATIESAAAIYTEDGNALGTTGNLSVADSDDINIESARVAITGNFTAGEDFLSFTDQAGIIGSYDAITGMLTLTGPATKAQYTSAIHTVEYYNSSDNPSPATRTVDYTVNDGDIDSNVLSRDIEILPVNDAPLISMSETLPLIYTENDTATAISPTIEIADYDNLQLDSATIQISGNFIAGEDKLIFNNQSGISGSYNPFTGTLGLSGMASLADYEAALRSVSYENTSENPSSLTRTVEYTVNDGAANSTIITRDIEIIPTNDAPVLDTIEVTAANFTENSAPTTITTNLTLTDVDDTTVNSATVAITTNHIATEDTLLFTDQSGISGTYNNTTGELSLTGIASLADYQAAIHSVTYQNSSENPSPLTRQIEFSIHDGSDTSNLSTRDINITPVNDAPSLTSIETIPATYLESSSPISITNTLQLGDVDDAMIDSASINISGNFIAGEDMLTVTSMPGISSSYNASTGVLTLTGVASVNDYESVLLSATYHNTSANPSSLTRSVEFVINDGALNSNIATRDILITTIDNAPVLSTLQTTSVGYIENSTPLVVNDSIIIEDVDSATLSSATVIISGNFSSVEDVLSFNSQSGITGTYNNNTGELNLTGVSSVANYQAALRSVNYQNTSDDPIDLTRSVTFIVNDGTSSSNLVTSDITLNAVNDAPTLSNIENTEAQFIENGAESIFTNSIILTDLDDTQIESAKIIISGNYHSAEDALAFTDQFGITGNFDISTGTLTLTGSASLAGYESAIRSITYTNTSDDPSTETRTIEVSISDGDANSNTIGRNIAIVAINDTPILSGIDPTPMVFVENQQPALVYASATITDIDDLNIETATVSITNNYNPAEDILSFTPVAGINGTFDSTSGTLTLSGSASVSDYEATLRSVTYQNTSENPDVQNRTVDFTITDGDSFSNIKSRTIEINTVNDPPQGSDTDQSLLEDSTSIISLTDFDFADPLDNNNFKGIIVSQMPTLGQLTLAGSPFTAGQYISASDIQAGLLTYTPDTNGQGSAYDSFRFLVVDDGGTLSNGVDTATTDNEYLFNVANVSDAPTGEDKTIVVPENTNYQFTESDFSFSDVFDNDQFTAVTIVTLPDSGILSIANTPVLAGATLSVEEINAGLLQYAPPTDLSNQQYSGFAFRVHDSGTTNNNGSNIDDTNRFINIDIPGVNNSPLLISEGQTVAEGSNTVIDTDALSAIDSDDTSPQDLTFSLNELPSHGILTLNGNTLATGDTFTLEQLQQDLVRYIHDGSETSADSFGIQVSDGGEDGVQPVQGRFNLLITEVIDPAPTISDEMLEIVFGNSFDSQSGDKLVSGATALSESTLIENPGFSIEIETHPAHGSVTLNEDGTFTYMHDGSNILQDSFSYRVTNEDGVFAIATVAVSIEPPIATAQDNIAPIATPLATSAAEPTPEPDAVIDETVIVETEVKFDHNFHTETQAVFSESASTEVATIATNTYDLNFNNSLLLDSAQRVLAELHVKKHNKLEHDTFQHQNITFSTSGFEILAEVTYNKPVDVVNNKNFLDGLAQFEQDMEDSDSNNDKSYSLANETAIGISISTTAGILAWALRGGALFASVMASTPLWSNIDPVRVLGGGKQEEEQNTQAGKDGEIEQYFEN